MGYIPGFVIGAAMGMRRHPRGDFAFVGVTPTQADVAYQPAAILNMFNKTQ